MRLDPTRGGRRTARVLILGLSSLLLGVGAHLIGGGALPSPGLLAVIIAPLGLVAAAMTRRRCRLPVLAAVLIMEQLGLHLILSLADSSVAVTGGTHAAHLITVVGPAPGSVMITTPAMWLAHLAATVLTAALLARGETAWWRLVETVAALIRPRRRHSRTRVPICSPDRSLCWSDRLHPRAPRRGPPLVLA